MAVTVTNHCPVCKTTVTEMRANDDYNPTCHACRQKVADEKRTAFLAERAALPIEERLALIEQWIYDYKPPVNIRDIRF